MSEENEKESAKRLKTKALYEGVDQLSLGISMVVAVIFGVGIGLGLRYLFGYDWLLWLGVFWGVAAAGLNVFKAYQKQVSSYDKIKDDPKYQHKDLYKEKPEEKKKADDAKSE